MENGSSKLERSHPKEHHPASQGPPDGSGSPDAATGRRDPRWDRLIPDPDDRSDYARFRRRIAALAREVMLARDADPTTLPPPLLDESSRDPAPAPGASPPRGAAPGPGVSPAPGARPSPSPSPPPGARPAPSLPPSYFDIGSTAPYLLEAAARGARSVVQRDGVTTGAVTTDTVLLAIAGSTGGVTTRNLGRVVGLASSTLSTAVGRLADDGLVTRRPAPRDRRCRLLEATPEGRGLAERVAARWRQVDDGLLNGLTHQERDELCRLLRRAASALAEWR